MPSHIKERMQADLADARRQRDRTRTVLLSTVLSELHNREIETGQPLDDGTAVQVVSRAIKQRREAARQMRDGGREELAEREEREAEMLVPYLPEQMGEDEVRALVRETIAEGVREMGPLMGRIMPKIRGRFDGREASRIVREELAE